MGAEQQALHHQGHLGGGCRGRRCRDLHRHGCRGQCQGVHLRLRGSVLHVASTDC
ncbi:UDP-galactose transporter 2 [Zea mays]|nr:UDP-galactose transporter 2 [Zea mays]